MSVPVNAKRLKKLSFDSLGFTVSVTLQIKTVDTPSLGLREGDIIDKIQGLRVNDLFNEKVVVKELKRVIDESSNGSTANLNLTVKRSGSNRQSNTNNTNTLQHPSSQSHQQNQNSQQPGNPQILHQHQSSTHSVGNLYVQPPTRQNNKSFDSTNTPLPPPPPPPPRPPLPNEFDPQAMVSPSLPPPPATNPLRSINFIKQNQLGIRLSGGNKTGIIVSAVQKNSQADLQGLTTNDKIIRVNEHDFMANPPTREQAIEILSSIPNDTLVNLTVEKLVIGSPQGDRIGAAGTGLSMSTSADHQDEFFIRTRVHTDEMRLHQVLLITDTLVNGLVGQWEAHKVDNHGNKLNHEPKLIIPNMKNARELLKKSWKRTTSFRNREYEELLQVAPATEPYEIVEKAARDVHTRPVILYTPLNNSVIEVRFHEKACMLHRVSKTLNT